MRYILDASALLPLLTKRGQRLHSDLPSVDLIVTDLAIYEACNGFWKLATLLRIISLQEAQVLVDLLNQLITKNLIQTSNYTAIDLKSVLDLSHSNRLSFYDASYIMAAQKVKRTLVTEDQRLFKVAKDHVDTVSFARLEEEF